LVPSRGGACFCTRGALQGYDCYLFILALAKTVTPEGSPRGSGAGRGASHKAFLFSYPIVAPRSANDIYRPVRDSSGFIFIYSEQRRTHLSTDEQVSFSTRQTATHPVKRSPTAELGCLASRSGLVLNVLFVAINLSCGALASHFAARCSAGPPSRCDKRT